MAGGAVYVAGRTGGGSGDGFVRKVDSSGNVLWSRQLATSSDDGAVDVAADSGGLCVVGYTDGALPGQSGAGGFDAFVRKYDAAGNESWTRQFGTAAEDRAISVALSGSDIYVVGVTWGQLPGQAFDGGADVFVRKYDGSGNELWTRQFGSSGYAFVNAVEVDETGLYLVGNTIGVLPDQIGFADFDAFVRKYDNGGNQLWTRQFGTDAEDRANGVAVRDGEVYVVGYTAGTLPNQVPSGPTDAYLRKYDASGNESWTRQFGSYVTAGIGVAADLTGAYVVGYYDGVLSGHPSAGWDVFIRKYDAAGGELWTSRLGSPEPYPAGQDLGMSGAVDHTGLYVTGFTNGTLPGETSAGDYDVFLVKFDPAFLPVTIDIKPGSFPNSINLGSSGAVPVAIWSSPAFDATEVDPLTVTLASAPVKLKGNGAPMASRQDLNRDGLLDLVVHVDTEALELSETDTEAVLVGTTVSGQWIRGVDSVRVVP